MSDKQSSFECTLICWGVAAIVGFAAMVMLYMLAEFSGLQAFFTGGLIGFLLGLLLTIFACRGQRSAADLAAEEKPAQRYKREAAEDMASRAGGAGGTAGASHTEASAGAADHAEASASGSGASGHAEAPASGSGTSGHAEAAASGSAGSAQAEASGASTSAAASGSAAGATTASSLLSQAPAGDAGVKPSASLAGEEELAGRKGEWKYEAGDSAPAAKPKAKAKAKPKAAKPAADAAQVAAEAAPAASTADVAEVKPATLYDAPPSDGADDLKLISGVGPKLEQTLNDLGVYRFAQVADWGPSDIAWVDNRLKFKGRIIRDDWMSQAKILAEGGETEFSARKKK